MATPAPAIAFVEDIYRIGGAGSRRAWFVVYTDPNREVKVVEKLEAMHVVSFMPVVTEWKPRTRAERDQKKPLEAISRPLLSRYLFVDLPDAGRAFALVQQVEGVREILGLGERKTAVPSSFIEHLREREAAGDFNKTEKRGRIVAPKWARDGASVEVKSGPFAGFLATIIRCLPRNQVEVAISLFGRSAPTRLDLSTVKHVDA